jgi:hypothetical protein
MGRASRRRAHCTLYDPRDGSKIVVQLVNLQPEGSTPPIQAATGAVRSAGLLLDSDAQIWCLSANQSALTQTKHVKLGESKQGS